MTVIDMGVTAAAAHDSAGSSSLWVTIAAGPQPGVVTPLATAAAGGGAASSSS